MNGLIGRPICRGGKTWNQEKNTSLITDILGPFPDEPLLSAVDKALHLSCSIYATLNGSAKTSSTVYNSRYLSDRSSSSSSKSSISGIPQDQVKPRSLFISHSSPDLLHLEYDQNKSPRFEYCPKFKNAAISPYQQNKELGDKHWVKTKTKNGIKCYEIWTDDECNKCPSIMFILSQSGETIAFESACRE